MEGDKGGAQATLSHGPRADGCTTLKLPSRSSPRFRPPSNQSGWRKGSGQLAAMAEEMGEE